ncbi:osteocrin [Cololabis saira]|uniref:osteocrin n=1 Tax=Cololabis saira TaxID=129043 RepID=UPI002AD37B9B|nr:osteocrin [Cololabis saira]
MSRGSRMQSCSHLLFALVSIGLLLGAAHGFRLQQRPAQRLDRPVSGSPKAPWLHPGLLKPGHEPTAKLVQWDETIRMANDVMEPKRRRGFPGNNAPLDRLGISSMETRRVSARQSKAEVLPRQRFKPPRIDRIGKSGLPKGR